MRLGRTSTCVLLGVPVDDVTLDEAVERIAEMVARGRATGSVHQVATINVDFLVNAALEPPVRRVLQDADLSIPDGMPVVWASRLLGTPIRQRTAGADLVPAIAERCARDGSRLLLFGAAAGVAVGAAGVLRARWPQLDVAAVEAPSIDRDGVMDASGVLAGLRTHDADVVCVALGNPKQERWIARYGAELGAPVCVGVGGSLDFLTGITRRAPAWMQRVGLEWLHRAMSEPRRLVGRYARDFRVFLPGIARQAWRGRRRGAAAVPGFDATAVPPRLVLTAALPSAAPEPALQRAVSAGRPLAVDLSGAGDLDNVSRSALAGLARDARRTGTSLELRGGAALGDVELVAILGAALLRDQSRGNGQ